MPRAVSRDSAKVPAGQARALIVGNVGFEIDLRCTLIAGQKLILDDEYGRPLKLSGQIMADVGVYLEQESSHGKR